MSRCLTTLSAALVFVAALAAADTATAQRFDPKATEHVKVVELITNDDEGKERTTKLWVVLLAGEAYLRTNASNWLANLKRNPAARLRVEGTEYPVMTEVISDPMWVDRVDQASKEKYGWQETSIHLFRLWEPTIVRLHPAS